MYLFVAWVDKTSNLIYNSISISNELQQRVDSADFSITGFKPNYFDDIKIFEGFPILSSTANTITLKKDYWQSIQNNIFRIWDVVTVAINLSDEEDVTISEISENSNNLKLTFSTNFINIPAIWELSGKKRFAGNIIDIQDKNNTILQNLEYSITALDYTRIFDKKLINDTYEDRDARYMINDFCNVTINRNQTIDQFDYANTTALRVAWIESWDWNNPTLDTSDFRETNWSWVFDWTYSAWLADFTNTSINFDISSFAWVSSWTPTSGRFGFWYKATDYTKITSITAQIWNDWSNCWRVIVYPTNNEWTFFDVKMSDLTIIWAPDWTAVDYLYIRITQTATSSLKIDWIRILEDEFFRHYPYISDSAVFTDFKINRVKPTETMQRLADSLAWYWYIDYNKYIWLFPNTTIQSPIQINETSNNFSNLSITYDTSRLINRQVVKWAEETSESKYTQVIEWNSIVREWIAKNKFKNLVVKLNDWTSTDTAEAGTDTTTINATAHGLVAWDYIVNRTRGNAVREVLTVPSVDQFTVAIVTWQTTWDTFSLFVAQTVWVEWLNEETSYDYMSNFNEKSIKSSSSNVTLNSWEFLLFNYNEIIPILVQRTDNVSVALMKSILWYTDWIFDWQPIIDTTITSRVEAIKTAEAVINKYSNVVITATFSTNQEWLEAGQLIRIKDTTSSSRNIDQDFIIQSVKMRQLAWGENSYQITCSSLLFGILELLQQLLANNRKIKVNEDEVINNIEDSNETIIISDAVTTDIDWEVNTETMIISDILETDVIEPPFYWGPIPDEWYILTEDWFHILTEAWDSIITDTIWPQFIWNLWSWA